jgi:serine/threonine protein kinase
MLLAPGTKLGPYLIASAIGAGGMGEVYKAHDSRLNRDVAIKVLPEHLSNHPDALNGLNVRLKHWPRFRIQNLYETPMTIMGLGHAYGVAGQKEKALEMLDRLKQLSVKRYVPYFTLAVVHLGLNEHNQGLDLLEKSFEEREGWLILLKVDSWFHQIRSDPRFLKLTKQLGF